MDLAEFDPVMTQTGERFRSVLELDRQMAAVVIDAEMFVQPEVARTLGPQQLEELHGFRAGFQVTERFRFENELKWFAGTSGEPLEVLDAAPEVGRRFGHLARMPDELLERHRHSADAPAHARRDNFGQQIDQEIG